MGLLFVLFLGAPVLGGADLAYEAHMQPFIRRFDEANGLPTRAVHGVAAGKDGLLWVLSDGGLCRFDGARFEAIPLPQPHSAPYEQLFLDSTGRWWITTVGSNELIFGDRGAWQTLRIAGANQILSVADRRENGATVVYIAASNGLYRYRNAALEPAPQSLEKPPTALLGEGDALWVASAAGLVRFGADAASSQSARGLRDQSIFALARRSLGGLFVLADTQLVALGGDAPFAPAAEPLPALTLPRGIAELDGGRTLWVATQDGRIWWRSDDRWTHVERLDDGTSIGEVFALAALTPPGEAASLWVATDRGLLQVLPHEWRRQRPQSPLFKIEAQRFGESADKKTFFVGGQGAAVAALDATQVRTLTVGAPGDLTLAIHTAGGATWIGTRSGRLSRVERAMTTVQPTVADDSIFGIAGAASGLLLAQRFGPSVLADGASRASAGRRQDDQLWGRLFAAARVGEQSFVGGEDGLFEWREARWSKIPLPVESQVLFLAEEKRDALWVGTAGEGAFRFALADRSWKHFSTNTSPPLPNAYIDALAIDDDGGVFFCTEKGVFHLSAQGAAQTFTRGNGLPTDTCLHGGMYRDHQGRIWVATNAGTAVFDPAVRSEALAKAPLSLREVKVKGEAAAPASWQTLTHDRASIAFSYVLPRFVRGDDVRYRTQLIGLETEPGVWTSEPQREFPTLPAGSYEMRVWAKDASSESGPISAAFVVLPPWWQTPWAFFAYALGIAGSAFGAGRLRIRQLRRRAEALEAIVQKRTEEVRKQAAEILAQKEALEASYQEADRIFEALKAALKGSILDDRYKLNAELGQGGYGVVYEAEEVRTGKVLAVKVFRPQPGNDSVEALERFKQEARSGQTFQHPHAIRIYEFGVSRDNIAYMVMERLHGESLQKELDRCGSISSARCLAIARTVAQVLAAAHAAGIVHRDIKPDNIFTHHGPDGDVLKVLDFGVAKLTAPPGGAAMQTLTMTGAVVGTPTYIAPERLSGTDYDGRSDVYSLGIMLYEILCGKPPFTATKEGILSLITAHLSTPPPPLSEKVAGVPPALEQAIMLALTKDPNQRPTAGAFAEVLMQIPDA